MNIVPIANEQNYHRRANKKYDDDNSQDEVDNKSIEEYDEEVNNSIDSLIGHVKDTDLKVQMTSNKLISGLFSKMIKKNTTSVHSNFQNYRNIFDNLT